MNSHRELGIAFHKHPTLPGNSMERGEIQYHCPESLMQCIVPNYLAQQQLYWRCWSGP